MSEYNKNSKNSVYLMEKSLTTSSQSVLDGVLDYYQIPTEEEISKMVIKYPEMDNPHKIRDKSWDFSGANTKEYTHCFHAYPAMMIPQIARRLIKLYAKKSDALLDPFCGSGSVLLEAKIMRLKVYGIDINPLAQLIARTKTTLVDVKELKNEYKEIIEKYLNSKNIKTPDFFNIDYWFLKSTIQELAKLRKAIFEIKNEKIQDFFKVVFSETVRDVSNTRNSEFKLYRIPENKLGDYKPDVFKTFKSKFLRNLEGLKALSEKIKNNETQVIILDEDSRKRTSLDSNSVDVIITSPPYGDSKTTVAYGQFSRLSLQWLGFERDNIRIDKKSLGGKKPNFNDKLKSTILKRIILFIAKRDRKRALEVLNFFIDLQECFSEFNRIMKQKSTLCFVLGNRTVKEVKIPTDEIIREMGESFGWKYEKTIIRKIPNKRMPSKNSPSNIKGAKGNTMSEEHIVIFNNR